MPLVLELALKNTLRNKRRTLLTAVTVMLGTALLTIAISWVWGIFGSVLKAGSQITGHVRLVDAEYVERERLAPLYLNLPATEALVQAAKTVPGVVAAYPRIQMPVAASTADNEIGETFGLLIGAPLAYHQSVLELDQRVTEGTFFGTTPDDEALVGRTLAEQMGIHAGAEAIFLGQTQDGSISPIKVKVAGIVDTGNGLFDRQVFVPLEKARWMADIPDGALEVLVYGTNYAEAPLLAQGLERALGPELRVTAGKKGLRIQPWTEREPYAGMLVVVRSVFGTICAIIVFVTGLGVLNTMLMSVLERTGEIGVLRALGLRPAGVVATFVAEAIAIAVVGGAVGAVVGTGVAIGMETWGIDLGSTADKMASTMPVNRTLFANWEPLIPCITFLLATVMALIGSLTPSLRAARIQPVTAMRARR